jgi:hypothetical protein
MEILGFDRVNILLLAQIGLNKDEILLMAEIEFNRAKSS